MFSLQLDNIQKGAMNTIMIIQPKIAMYLIGISNYDHLNDCDPFPVILTSIWIWIWILNEI